MFRKRLRSLAGCERCRNRHRKCDEKRPRCTFCVRHNLRCVWPNVLQPPRQVTKQSTKIASEQSWLAGTAEQASESLNLDYFHGIPIRHTDDVTTIASSLHNFFVKITQGTLPFDVSITHDELTHGWLTSVYSDEAVCSSFVTYCAWFYSTKTTQQASLIRLSLEHEARSLSLLRDRIEKHGVVTEGTLLAAALHFFIATFGTRSVLQLAQIAQGISALVAAKGGSKVMMRNIRPSTMQSLIFVDIFNSLLSAERPFLEDIEFPARPDSYDSLFPSHAVDQSLASCLDRQVVEVLEDLRFAIFFRAPSQQSRRLSSLESRYLFMLLQKISYGLCAQQHRLMNTRALSEIAMYGMILVKEEVLLDIVQHPIMPVVILQRLSTALSELTIPLEGPALTIALWTTTMALVGTGFKAERVRALEFLAVFLDKRFGSSWPQDWTSKLRQDLVQILWHHRIEIAFEKICVEIESKHCDVSLKGQEGSQETGERHIENEGISVDID